MQTESGVNAVGVPMGAPTCPPCVASSAAKSGQLGAQSPVLGSQFAGTGPHASTLPPPVTRQPDGTQVPLSVDTHWPVDGLHESSVQGLLSLHCTVFVVWHEPDVVLQDSVVQALLSLQVTVFV